MKARMLVAAARRCAIALPAPRSSPSPKTRSSTARRDVHVMARTSAASAHGQRPRSVRREGRRRQRRDRDDHQAAVRRLRRRHRQGRDQGQAGDLDREGQVQRRGGQDAGRDGQAERRRQDRQPRPAQGRGRRGRQGVQGLPRRLSRSCSRSRFPEARRSCAARVGCSAVRRTGIDHPLPSRLGRRG